MKKTYNQPQIQVMALMPTTIICASITNSEKNTSESGGAMYTD